MGQTPHWPPVGQETLRTRVARADVVERLPAEEVRYPYLDDEGPEPRPIVTGLRVEDLLAGPHRDRIMVAEPDPTTQEERLRARAIGAYTMWAAHLAVVDDPRIDDLLPVGRVFLLLPSADDAEPPSSGPVRITSMAEFRALFGSRPADATRSFREALRDHHRRAPRDARYQVAAMTAQPSLELGASFEVVDTVVDRMHDEFTRVFLNQHAGEQAAGETAVGPDVAVTSDPPPSSAQACDHGWTYTLWTKPAPRWKCMTCGATFAYGARPSGHPCSAWGREQAKHAAERAAELPFGAPR